MLRVFLLEIRKEFQMLVGKPLHLFEMLGEWQETKSNTASATDHSSSVFVLSAPDGAEAADFLSPFPILRLQRLVKSKHLIYIRGVFQSKDLSLSTLN